MTKKTKRKVLAATVRRTRSDSQLLEAVKTLTEAINKLSDEPSTEMRYRLFDKIKEYQEQYASLINRVNKLEALVLPPPKL